MKYWNAIVRPVFAAAAVILVSGCAALTSEGTDRDRGAVVAPGSLPVVCSNNATPEQSVELDAIDDLMATSENYAALARLETLSFSTQQHWLRWAELMAKVEQVEQSESAFAQIVATCGSAEAYHGLGVVHLKSGNVQEGIKALQEAKNLSPASAGIRNDFGIGLLRSGLYGQAAFELRTAFELSGHQKSVARSMVAAYFLHGGEQLVTKLQRETGLTAQVIASGMEFAQQFSKGA